MAIKNQKFLNKLNFLQIDLKHCKLAMSELFKTVKELNVDINFC
jgi:hypothetical protein